jgi:hypothetical protein
MSKCPGQDKRDIKAETINCPDCGYCLEIFSDEVKVRCPKCKGLVCRNRLPSCVDWCRYARECVGEDKWEQLKGEIR